MLGIVFGIAGLVFCFRFFRGRRWARSNFVLGILLSVALLIVSIRPESVDGLRDFLALEQTEYGRILGLLVISVLFLFALLVYSRSQILRMRVAFDRLIRSLGAKETEPLESSGGALAPIMIVIPAFNEADNLRQLLPKIPKALYGRKVGVIVIDDASDDGTSTVARQSGALVVRNVVNRGQGASSRLGYDILKKFSVEIGVTMDADNQHRPEDVEGLLEPIINNKADLVIGSRMRGTREDDSAIRLSGIVVLTGLINFLTGLRLTDCSSGFKAFKVSRISDLFLYEEQFQAAELLITAAKSGLRICEVPVNIKRRKFGQSKKGGNLTYGVFFAKTILKTWWR